MGRHGSPKTLWGNILKEGTAGVDVLEQNMLGWGIFLRSLLRVEGTHKWSNALTKGCGNREAQVSPGGTGGNGRTGLSPSFYVLAHSSLALGQRPSMYRQTDRWERTPTEPAQLDTEWVWRWAGKAVVGRWQRSLFSVWVPKAAS